MARFTIQPGGVKIMQTPNRWLNVLDASAVFVLAADGLTDMQVKKDWQVDVSSVTQIELKNNSQEAIELDIENTPLPVQSSSGGSVTIEGKPIIQRIEESISVTASATVEDGAVKAISPDAALTFPDVEIAAGQTVKVIDARPGAFNRSVTLQTVSDTTTSVRVGFLAGLTAGQGTLLRGYKDSPATIGLNQDTAIYVHNESAETAKISVSEAWKS